MTLYVSLGFPSSAETDAGEFLEQFYFIKEQCSFLLPYWNYTVSWYSFNAKGLQFRDLMDWRWQFSVLLITRQICQSESWSEIDIHIKFLNNGKTSGVTTTTTTHHPSSHPAYENRWLMYVAMYLGREEWGGGKPGIFQEETSRFLSVTW